MLLRSMFSAISGLRGHQTWMDVIGNNIANLNTPGFKTGRVRFEDVLAQTVHGASQPDNNNAGINPAQIGLGSTVDGIDTINTQGALQATGKVSDLAIQGEGYFILTAGNQTFYSRDGSFDIGIDRKLVNPATGMYVMGWQAATDGTVDTTQPIGTITIPLGQQLDAQPSTAIAAQGNLDAGAANGDTYTAQVTIVDSLGAQHDLTLTFTKTGNNTWSWAYSTTESGVTITNGTGTIQFDPQGHVQTVTPSGDLTIAYTSGAANTVIPNGGDFSLMTQLQSPSNAAAVGNGATAGALTSFSVTDTGQIVGVYSNGSSKVLGQIATATFANPGGLQKMGQNLWNMSPNSGNAVIDTPGANGHGTVASGYLESSNVDLAEQFSEMIMAQRGFQANSRVITTSDELLQELVNLKR